MASNYTIIGGASCVWGVDEEMSGVGTITDVNYDDVDITEVCENQEGAVDGMVSYDGNKTVSMSIVAKVSATLPVKGAILTIGTEKFVIQKVGKAKKHKGKNIISVSAIHHDNMVLA